MKRLFITLSLFFVWFCITPAFGQSCRVDIISMEAKIKARPDSVLYHLGDAIALRPDCIGELIETAVKASSRNSSTVSEIVKLAVSEYPQKASTIAESAVIASPENVHVIRRAFEAAKNGSYKPKYHKKNLPNNASPIEKFLASYQTSKPYDANDVANKGLAAIDRMLEKLKNNEPLVREKTEPATADAAPEVELVAEPVPVKEEPKIEEFKMVEMIEESITTINDPTNQDKQDEMLLVEEDELIIEDPKGPTVAEILEEKAREIEEEEKLKREMVEKTLVKNRIQSSVYHIPSADKSILPLLPMNLTVIRSRSVSPTLPRARN